MIWRVVLWVVGAFAVLIFVGWCAGWMAEPARITGVQNVREQWRFAYDYTESLEAIALQVCLAEEALAGATTDGEAAQRRSQIMAYQQNYARVQAQYEARLRDAFRAGLVKPPDVPRTAPSLPQAKASAGC